MNKLENKNKKIFLSSRIKDFLWMGVLALLLFSVAFVVFRADDDTNIANTSQMSEVEQKVARILQEIDGVGDASVIVCEDENSLKNVVVVCEGANNLRVVMDIREVVSAALNTQPKLVKIYLKKD